jgi:cupin 2 domain-containing protein
MLPRVANLFTAGENPSGRAAEEVTPLFQASSFRLEHIVSHGQPSPPGFWYDQSGDEWVVLLRGAAVLVFGEDGSLELVAGDSLTIPAHLKHRVEKVSEDAVWIAAHFRTLD